MKDDLRVLLRSFPSGATWRLVVLTVGQTFASLFDVVGIAMALPILQILGGSDITQGYLGTLHRLLGDVEPRWFVVQLCGLMTLSFLIKAVSLTLLQWWSSGFIGHLQANTSRLVLERFLNADYLYYKQNNTAHLMRAAYTAVIDAHARVLGGLINVITSAVSITMIMAFLLVAVPLPALFAVGYLALIVMVTQKGLAGPNRRAGVESHLANWESTTALVESMNGFRELRMHNAEQASVTRFDVANRKAVEVGRKANLLALLPKQFLEFSTILGLALLLAVVALSGSDAASLVPTLGLFVAAAMKLLPATVGLTATIGGVRQGAEGLRITAQTLRDLPSVPTETKRQESDREKAPLSTLEVNNVSFQYPDGHRPVVRDVSFTVPPGTSLALCGSSGSGKTTLADITLGLISPNSGDVLYAGRPIAETPYSWRETVAYVPQDVHLFDGTLRENVAFGVPPEDVDEDRIMTCIEATRLGDLVAELPHGLDTTVGERGKRLSGGQRQRIGIARALYRQPQVLVLDEATSALDNETERQIIDTLAGLSGRISTIVVAHRLSTVQHVDHLLYLKDGEVSAQGTFTELQHRSPEFAHLVAIGALERAAELAETDADHPHGGVSSSIQ